MAQKAAVKILVPTLLFIFPTIFVVLVGPAFYQIQETFLQQQERPGAMKAERAVNNTLDRN